ncbi:MAG: ribbon-helix-helix domain-containing protein [Candidatus Methanomethylicia archaeon]|nr:ribbon-helix-helix domain-containing protein [Candidatus Methanomethylicia archaeon]MCX8168830.1 ribbon-helix-helix domain-containing protein [Candidatus Methanomethylicia archaeon]MDW7988562.1 ribbon-helix-helix domain-containing protein [Nitrososphaerota archaeon]
MKIICIRLHEGYVEIIDELIRAGVYPSRSEFIRTAIREQLKRDLESKAVIRRIIREI